VCSIAVCVAVCSVAACTSHPTPTPTPTPSARALQGLQEQASMAAARSFTASYEAAGTDPDGSRTSSTVRIYRTPSAARIDVDETGITARILINDEGTFSCKLATGATPLCVTLAGPGERLSPSLALQLQFALLFTSAPAEIADGAGFQVEAAPERRAQGDLPAASCYAIISSPDGDDVAPGTYCYSKGLLVSADFRTGSLTLMALGATPVDGDFSLPASPVPLQSPSSSPPA